MNEQLLPFAQTDAGTRPAECFLRVNGPALYHPRATPWVTGRKKHLSPEGATQPPRPDIDRPYRAEWEGNPKPRALPWAGIVRTVGAEEAEGDLLFHDTVASQLSDLTKRLLT